MDSLPSEAPGKPCKDLLCPKLERWSEEPGGLQSTASQRVGHDLAAEHNDYCDAN